MNYDKKLFSKKKNFFSFNLIFKQTKIMFSNIPDDDLCEKSYNNWEIITRPVHTTIKTILDIPIGTTEIFLFLDRNVLDIAMDTIKEHYGKKVSPMTIFQNNTFIKYTKTGEGLSGNYLVYYGLKDLENNDDDGGESDFEIEYEENEWYPMENNKIPKKGPKKYVGKHWNEFPITTRLGWRGPMIPFKYINKYPFKYI